MFGTARVLRRQDRVEQCIHRCEISSLTLPGGFRRRISSRRSYGRLHHPQRTPRNDERAAG